MSLMIAGRSSNTDTVTIGGTVTINSTLPLGAVTIGGLSLLEALFLLEVLRYLMTMLTTIHLKAQRVES